MRRLNQERQQQLAANKQMGARDDARGLLQPGYEASLQYQAQRARPEELPAAGARHHAEKER